MKITPFLSLCYVLSPTKALVWFVNPRISRDQQIGEQWRGRSGEIQFAGPHALDPPRSAVASKPSLQQPTQPSLEGNNNIHTWPTLPTAPVLPVQATQATCPAVARLGLISGNSVTETEILGENRLQAERATVLTLPAYSRLFPRGKRTLQQLPLFTRAREP